jgi:hypothetical protein
MRIAKELRISGLLKTLEIREIHEIRSIAQRGPACLFANSDVLTAASGLRCDGHSRTQTNAAKSPE